MNELELLKEARKLLGSPEFWNKGNFSKIDVTTGNHSYCVLGAIRHVAVASSDAIEASVIQRKQLFTERNTLILNAQKRLDAVARKPRPRDGKVFYSAVEMNDHNSTTHGDIKALFDQAIREAQEGVKRNE